MNREFSFTVVHWGLEPVGRVTPWAPQFGNAQTARRGLTRPTFRFMESPHVNYAVHWDHEPMAFPLTRPSDTLSPVRERDGVPRFMESPLGLVVD